MAVQKSQTLSVPHPRRGEGGEANCLAGLTVKTT